MKKRENYNKTVFFDDIKVLKIQKLDLATFLEHSQNFDQIRPSPIFHS